MKFNFLNFLFLTFILSFLIFPLAASAVDYLPLVPCGLSQEAAQELKAEGKGDPAIDYSKPCARCDAFKLAENVIDFGLKGIVPPVAAVLFVAAGLMIVLAGANQKLYSTGISIFKDTFWGLVIILASWMIVNTFIQSFGPDQVKGSWFKFTCSDKTITGPGGPPGPAPAICSQPQTLAQQNNVPYPRKNAPELDALITCIRNNLPGENLGEVSTYDKTYDICNYVRGQRTCGSCIHEVNSCHYGGSSGSEGSLAVDFGNEDIGDKIIGAAVLQCGAKNGRCEDRKGNFVSCTSSSATHVHINSKTCDRN